MLRKELVEKMLGCTQILRSDQVISHMIPLPDQGQYLNIHKYNNSYLLPTTVEIQSSA